MKLSAKAKARMDEMLARFQAGDLSPLVAIAKTKVDPQAPAFRWSFSNKVLAYAQTGDLDCRTYKQWQEAGRQVKKGSQAGFIFTPRTIKEEKEDGTEGYKLIGFGITASNSILVIITVTIIPIAIYYLNRFIRSRLPKGRD